MKFRFTGGMDCPEWLLSQIPELSKTNTTNLQELCECIIERLQSMRSEWSETDLRQFGNMTTATDADGNVNAEALRALKAKIAALCFIFEKAAKNECSQQDLEKEMLQLGLPSDQVNILTEAYESQYDRLKGTLISEPPTKAASFSVLRQSVLQIGTKNSDAKYLRIQTLDTNGTSANIVIDFEQRDQLKQGIGCAIKELEAFVEK